MSTNKDQLKKHIKIGHEKRFNCDQCSYAAGLKTDLSRNIRAIHEKLKDFKCKDCGFETGLNLPIWQEESNSNNDNE